MKSNETVVRVGVLLRIQTANFNEYYFQNFQRTPNVIEFEGRTWEFIPIDFTPPSRNLDLENTTGRVTIPSLPEIIQAVEQNDGFRDSVVESYCLFPDDLNASPYALDLMVVRSCRITGVGIEIELQSPFSAVSATFPSVFWTTGVSQDALSITGFVPEAPIVAQVSLR